ncbi:hypothetical protein P154DRAFT_539585 [Amniculicola lignicola CBS 123094]|uniref:Uncharacterized protein n=1 Tax=Amniculicola lignicola CBS 123094 TaxID=1392246 RepID=A0A6A5VYF8_9PLEO|nr:hypothetical protein P154DRAFT_539585 [Amniculicola lignicola CBS 123094]
MVTSSLLVSYSQFVSLSDYTCAIISADTDPVRASQSAGVGVHRSPCHTVPRGWHTAPSFEQGLSLRVQLTNPALGCHPLHPDLRIAASQPSDNQRPGAAERRHTLHVTLHQTPCFRQRHLGTVASKTNSICATRLSSSRTLFHVHWDPMSLPWSRAI